MTAPRQILPGKTYLLTRRCVDQKFLLRPSCLTNAIVRFVLALAALRTGVLVHVACVMSNHLHLVVTDPDAKVPKFCQLLGGFVARAMNVLLGRWGAFWDERTFSMVVLDGPEDIVAKAAYTLANPVAAGLVSVASEWPGLWTGPELVGGPPLICEKPTVFFRRRGKLPALIELPIVPPPGFSPEQFRQALAAALDGLERQARRDREGKTFLGVKRVKAQSPSSRPARGKRGGLNPTFATRDPDRRRQLLALVGEFRRAYRHAWERFRAGVRQVLFPAGTYQMYVMHRVRRVEPA
jgi:REP element-mobilizing transposase RayT